MVCATVLFRRNDRPEAIAIHPPDIDQVMSASFLSLNHILLLAKTRLIDLVVRGEHVLPNILDANANHYTNTHVVFLFPASTKCFFWIRYLGYLRVMFNLENRPQYLQSGDAQMWVGSF